MLIYPARPHRWPVRLDGDGRWLDWERRGRSQSLAVSGSKLTAIVHRVSVATTSALSVAVDAIAHVGRYRDDLGRTQSDGRAYEWRRFRGWRESLTDRHRRHFSVHCDLFSGDIRLTFPCRNARGSYHSNTSFPYGETCHSRSRGSIRYSYTRMTTNIASSSSEKAAVSLPAFWK